MVLLHCGSFAALLDSSLVQFSQLVTRICLLIMLLLLPFQPIIAVHLRILIGEQLWQMSFRLWLIMVLGALFLGLLELMW